VADINFWVAGTPVQQGSKTPGQRNDGTLFVRENAAGLKPWRKAVAQAAVSAWSRKAGLGSPFTDDEPLHLEVAFYFPELKTARDRIWKFTAPDLDKLLRAVGDALQQSGLIKDDARIVSVEATKRHAAEGGAYVRVRSIDER
jgi:crossover junction endodeoxyribonuclease RusA